MTALFIVYLAGCVLHMVMELQLALLRGEEVDIKNSWKDVLKRSLTSFYGLHLQWGEFKVICKSINGVKNDK